MARSPRRFPAVSGVVDLVSDAVVPGEQIIFSSEAGEASWRIIEMASQSNLPWRAKVKWGYNGGQGPFAWLDVPSARRVCVYASMVEVLGINLTNQTNTVRVLASDTNGALVTENTFSRVLTTPAGMVVDVPSFAYAYSAAAVNPANPIIIQVEDHAGNILYTGQGGLNVPFGIGCRLRVTCLSNVLLCFHLRW